MLIADFAGFERAAYLAYVALAGGDSAMRRPYRVALAHLRNSAAIASQNTLIYTLINLRFLQRLRPSLK